MELDDLTDDELTLVIDHLNARDLISLEAVSKRFTRNQLETAAEKNLRARYPAAAAYLQTLSPLRWRRFLHGQEQLDLDRDCARLRVSHLSQEEAWTPDHPAEYALRAEEVQRYRPTVSVGPPRCARTQ